jgi:hypothetical protein
MNTNPLLLRGEGCELHTGAEWGAISSISSKSSKLSAVSSPAFSVCSLPFSVCSLLSGDNDTALDILGGGDIA